MTGSGNGAGAAAAIIPVPARCVPILSEGGARRGPAGAEAEGFVSFGSVHPRGPAEGLSIAIGLPPSVHCLTAGAEMPAPWRERGAAAILGQ